MPEPAPEQSEADADPYLDFMRRADAACVPLAALWELTDRCNLRCAHCYRVEHDPARELSFEEGVALLDQLADAGVLYLALTGGEPLLREHFFDIASAARRREFALRILTNGTLIGEREADKLADLLPFSVDISIYGARPETHDAITGVPGSHERAVRAISLLTDRRVRTSVKMVVMKPNVHEFDDVWAWAEGVADRFVYDVQLIPRLDGSLQPTRLQLSEDELTSFLAGKVAPRDEASCELGDDTVPCGAGRTGAAIAADGAVFPCVALPLVAGNVRERPFAEVWREAEILNQLRQITLKDLRECRSCGMITWCRRCPGAAYLERGDHRGRSDAACSVARAKQRAAVQQRQDSGREIARA